MRRYLLSLVIMLGLIVATYADEGQGGINELLVWPVAWANCLLLGYLMGWLIERLTRRWHLPAFLYRWFNFFTTPEDHNEVRIEESEMTRHLWQGLVGTAEGSCIFAAI